MLRQQQCTPPNTDLESCWMSSFCGNYLRFLSLDLFWQSIFSCLFYGKISGEKLLLLTKTELYVYEMRTTSKNACFYWQSHNTKKLKKILVVFYLNFLFCFLWYFLPQWLGTFLSLVWATYFALAPRWWRRREREVCSSHIKHPEKLYSRWTTTKCHKKEKALGTLFRIFHHLGFIAKPTKDASNSWVLLQFNFPHDIFYPSVTFQSSLRCFISGVF